jgi:hypothetical protein
MIISMLIKNLLIKFIRRQEEKLVFQTEAGAEIIFDSFLLQDKFDENKNYYLSLDSNAVQVMEESQKKVLNDLLGNDVER